MKRQRRIALAISKEGGFNHRVLLGILRYAHPARPWIFHNVALRRESPGELLRDWNPAGILASISTPEQADELLRLKCPVVDVAGRVDAPRLHRVAVDGVAVGRLAAQHLLGRGLRHFAFAGRAPSVQRAEIEAGLGTELHAAGRDYIRLAGGVRAGRRPSDVWTGPERRVAAQLRRMPKPFGIVLQDDELGLWMSQICRLAGVRVPEDAAILGVNNDEIECGLSHPSLSSVAIPAETIGREAAALLDRLMSRPRRQRVEQRLPPGAVVVRQSTDILAVDDPDTAAALHYIHAHAHEPIGVADVAREAVVSRRSLERRMKACIGRTPLEEIRHAHLELARRLLWESEAGLAEVARRSGIPSAQHLCALFRREQNVTPEEFRRIGRGVNEHACALTRQ